MSINHAILGILSYKPLTGYDLKKIMQQSSFMYWSGNNNQIYKALLELHDNGFVTNEIYHQDNSPSKKIYTITDDGLLELKKWLTTIPDAPEMKKTFLVQLAWTWQLSNDELNTILMDYEEQVRGVIALEETKIKSDTFSPARTLREAALWKLIHENVLSTYTHELEWISKVKHTISSFTEFKDDFKTDKEMEKMDNYKIIEKDSKKYLLLPSYGKTIQTEQDGNDIISLCWENDVNLILITGERISDDFMRLSTGVAGAILQKFTNYNLKAVAVLDEERTKGRFKEFLLESNTGNMFRAYKNISDAEAWLLS